MQRQIFQRETRNQTPHTPGAPWIVSNNTLWCGIFYLNWNIYLASRRRCKNGKWKQMRIFLCSGALLSKCAKILDGQWSSSHFRNSGPFHHLLALIKSQGFNSRDNISAGLLEDDANIWFLSGAEFHPSYLSQKLTTAVKERLSSLMRSLSPTKGKSGIESVKDSLTLLLSALIIRQPITLIAVTK